MKHGLRDKEQSDKHRHRNDKRKQDVSDILPDVQPCSNLEERQAYHRTEELHTDIAKRHPVHRGPCAEAEPHKRKREYLGSVDGKGVAADAIKLPLRDGDIERPDDEAYAGCWFVNANNTAAPGIVDAERQPILDRSEVYSGVYGRASISFYAFNSSGNKGIACSLNNLQKIADGEPLGGHASAEADFATDDDDDFLS